MAYAKSIFRVLSMITLLILTQKSVDARSKNRLRGVQVIPGKCEGTDRRAAEGAILDASYIASAGYSAAINYQNPPFSMFFDSTPENSHTVANIYQRIMYAEQGKSNLIGVTCQDTYNRCNSSRRPEKILAAYSVQFSGQHRAPQVVMCPSGLALQRAPEPCASNPGGISLGWLMVHSMTSLNMISGTGLNISDSINDTAGDVMENVLMGQETINDANAYSYLAAWSWAVGLGGPPWNGKLKCLDNLHKGDRHATLPP